MPTNNKLLPIYTTRGDLGGFIRYPYIYNPQGEWIAWVTKNQIVYSVHGHYAGEMTRDRRILRKREWGHNMPRRVSPPKPAPIRPPAHVPLAPQMPEVPLNMIDVLDEAEDTLPPMDWGDLRDDMD